MNTYRKGVVTKMSEFNRERRYAVVKLKLLTADQKKELQDLIDSFDLPHLQGVFIESGWDCYENAWQLVQNEWEHKGTGEFWRCKITELDPYGESSYYDVLEKANKGWIGASTSTYRIEPIEEIDKNE